MLCEHMQQRAAVGEVALHPGDAFLLERLVADREHLVGDQDLGRQRGGHREAQPHDHARRVVLDRIVDVLADVGEGDDLVALRARSRPARARAARPRGRCSRGPCIRDGSRSPSSSSAPTRPFTATLPRVGLITPAMIFSSVDLPAPFSPITPERLAAMQLERHAVERAEHVRAPGGRAAGLQTSRSRPPRASTFA